VVVHDDLELKINMRNDKDEDLCYWHSVRINCGPNSSSIARYDEILRGKGIKIRNFMNDLGCDITLYNKDGTAITTMRYEQKISSKIQIKF
jgi:hypothetical protein